MRPSAHFDTENEHPIVAAGPFAGARSACALPAVERRFGVLGCAREDTLHTVGRLGPWAERSPGTTQVGAAGVLIDHALGETLYAARAPGQWSLTTELALDVVVPPPWSAGDLHVMSSVLRGDATGGYARGELIDDSGRLLVTASSWTQYVTRRHQPERAGAQEPASATGAVSFVEHLGCEIVERTDGVEARLPSPHIWSNPYGVLHGGVWTGLAEMAAAETVERGDGDLVTAHVHLSFLRAARAGPVSAIARRRHQGHSFGHVDVTGVDTTGRECVLATVTSRPHPQARE